MHAGKSLHELPEAPCMDAEATSSACSPLADHRVAAGAFSNEQSAHHELDLYDSAAKV